MIGLLVIGCIVSTVLAGFIFGVMEVISDGKFINKSKWWNKEEGDKNKWKLKNGEPKKRKDNKKVWYYFGIYKPEYVEKFIFSSTLLLLVTDGWNFFKHLFFVLIFLTMFLGMCITGWSVLAKFLLVKSLIGVGLLVSEATKRYLYKKNSERDEDLNEDLR